MSNILDALSAFLNRQKRKRKSSQLCLQPKIDQANKCKSFCERVTHGIEKRF